MPEEWEEVLTRTRRWALIQGDCIEVMRAMPEASVDAIVTDPPYGLGFMGKVWDKIASMQQWHQTWAVEALRVLKPGGHLLAFGGTRTYHRLACAIEDAGFSVRDEITWCYSTGFPKSLSLAKVIDKKLGEAPTVVGFDPSKVSTLKQQTTVQPGGWVTKPRNPIITAPTSTIAKQWDGWGTALKPAHEPICVARKPFPGLIVDNVLQHGTGALHIDACRVVGKTHPHHDPRPEWSVNDGSVEVPETTDGKGRWPANLVFTHAVGCERTGTKRVRSNAHYPDYQPGTTSISKHGIYGGGTGLRGKHSYQEGERVREEEVEDWVCVPGCPVAILGRQSGESVTKPAIIGPMESSSIYGGGKGLNLQKPHAITHDDAGNAGRFFAQFQWTEMDYGFLYVPKASRSEREEGTEGLPATTAAERTGQEPGSAGLEWKDADGNPVANAYCGTGGDNVRNFHPTVKPIALTRWLCRLVTPPGGIVLDPFAGSGSIGIGALREKFRSINIEQNPEYVVIARARLGSQDDTPGVDEAY